MAGWVAPKVPTAPPAVAAPASGVDPAAPPAPVAPPSSLAEALAAVTTPPRDPPSPSSPSGSAGPASPPVPPPTPGPSAYAALDPEDVEAGRELLKMLRFKLGKWVAKMVYSIKEDDARLKQFEEDNGFLRVAMKRNQDKAAPIGKLSKGWKGIIIGLVLEGARVIAAFGMDGPDKKGEDKADSPAASPPKAADAPPPPPPAPAPDAPPKKSLAQKIADFRSGAVS